MGQAAFRLQLLVKMLTLLFMARFSTLRIDLLFSCLVTCMAGCWAVVMLNGLVVKLCSIGVTWLTPKLLDLFPFCHESQL